MLKLMLKWTDVIARGYITVNVYVFQTTWIEDMYSCHDCENSVKVNMSDEALSQPVITCSKLIMQPLEQGVKYVQR